MKFRGERSENRKFEEDRAALREAVTTEGQSKFFAGTDSAPHTTKATECGCAAGCYTGGCAPQLYAMAFEASESDLFSDSGEAELKRFLSTNGPEFYEFPVSTETFTMEQTPSKCETHQTDEGPVVPLPVGMDLELAWAITS